MKNAIALERPDIGIVNGTVLKKAASWYVARSLALVNPPNVVCKSPQTELQKSAQENLRIENAYLSYGNGVYLILTPICSSRGIAHALATWQKDHMQLEIISGKPIDSQNLPSGIFIHTKTATVTNAKTLGWKTDFENNTIAEEPNSSFKNYTDFGCGIFLIETSVNCCSGIATSLALWKADHMQLQIEFIQPIDSQYMPSGLLIQAKIKAEQNGEGKT